MIHLAAAAVTVLVILAAIHVYWAFGGSRGTAAVVPTLDGKPLFTPSTGATLGVAMLLTIAAALLVGSVLDWRPGLGFRGGSGGVAVVLFARAVGDRRHVGMLKRDRHTTFSRRDTFVYSPLCLLLSAGILAVVIAS